MYYYVCNLDIIREFSDPKQIIDLKLDYGNYGIKEPTIKKIFSKIGDYSFNGQYEISGIVFKHNPKNDFTQKTNFKLRSGSCLAFVETDKELEKIDAIESLNSSLSDFIKLSNFIPRRDKVKDFILKSEYLETIQLFTEKGIKSFDMDDIDNLKDKLSKYPLIEAELEFKIKKEKIDFYYYGDAIQFPPSTEPEAVEKVIQLFEEIMSKKKTTNPNSNIQKPAKCANYVFC